MIKSSVKQGYKVYLTVKCGYLDISHLTVLRNKHITEIYMKKKSLITKNHKKKIFLMVFP